MTPAWTLLGVEHRGLLDLHDSIDVGLDPQLDYLLTLDGGGESVRSGLVDSCLEAVRLQVLGVALGIALRVGSGDDLLWQNLLAPCRLKPGSHRLVYAGLVPGCHRLVSREACLGEDFTWPSI